MNIFPKRQWTSRLAHFPGTVAGGMEYENAQPSIPFTGSHLTAFSYSPSTLNLTVGAPMTPVTPTTLPAQARINAFQLLGQVFPPGLQLNVLTGEISGTPTAARATTTYRIYAKAAYDYVAEVTITVN